MQLISEELKNYLEKHCDSENELLKHIDRETNLKVPMPRMLSGHYQGRVLSMFSKLIRPSRILEIGTFTGYATICLAEGLPSDGILHTIEINRELEDRLHKSFNDSGLQRQIKLHIGNALEIVPSLQEIFDLVFIDADKKNNGLYYDLVFEKLRPGGVIIIDNVLWSGKVLSPEKLDQSTKQIHDFNTKISSDSRVEKLILPVRDGIFIVRKN